MTSLLFNNCLATCDTLCVCLTLGKTQHTQTLTRSGYKRPHLAEWAERGRALLDASACRRTGPGRRRLTHCCVGNKRHSSDTNLGHTGVFLLEITISPTQTANMLSVALESNGSPKKRTFSRGISEDESLRSIIKEVSEKNRNVVF